MEDVDGGFRCLHCDDDTPYGPQSVKDKDDLSTAGSYKNVATLIMANNVSITLLGKKRCNYRVMVGGQLTAHRCCNAKKSGKKGCQAHTLLSKKKLPGGKSIYRVWNPKPDRSYRVDADDLPLVPPTAIKKGKKGKRKKAARSDTTEGGTLQDLSTLPEYSGIFDVAVPAKSPGLLANTQISEVESRALEFIRFNEMPKTSDQMDGGVFEICNYCFPTKFNNAYQKNPASYAKRIVDTVVSFSADLDTFGVATPIAAGFFLPNPLLHGYNKPLSQFKQILQFVHVLSPDFSLHTDVLQDWADAARVVTITQTADGNTATSTKAPTTIDEGVICIAQGLARKILQGVHNKVLESVRDTNNFLVSGLPYPRLAMLMCLNHMCNNKSLSNVIGECEANLQLDGSLLIGKKQTEWTTMALIAQKCEHNLAFLDGGMKARVNNLYETGKDVDGRFSGKDAKFIAVLLQKAHRLGAIAKERGIALNPPAPKKLKLKDSSTKFNEGPNGHSASTGTGTGTGTGTASEGGNSGSGTDKDSDNEPIGEQFRKNMEDRSKYSQGLGSLENYQKYAVIHGKGDDHTASKQLKAPAFGAEAVMRSHWYKECGTLGLVVKQSMTKMDGLDFKQFIKVKDWYQINRNHLVRQTRGDPPLNTLGYAPVRGVIDFVQQELVMRKLCVHILGKKGAKDIFEFRSTILNTLKEGEVDWNEAWTIMDGLQFCFCRRVDLWAGDTEFPVYKNLSTTMKKNIKSALYRANVINNPVWEREWELKPKVAQTLTLNMDHENFLLAQKGVTVAKSKLNFSLAVQSGGKQSGGADAGASAMANASDNATLGTVKFGGVVSYDPPKVKFGKNAEDLYGIRCRCWSPKANDWVVCPKVKFCAFYNGKDTKRGDLRLVRPDGSEVKFCPFYHDDAPPGTTGLLKSLNPELQAHIQRLERDDGVFLYSKTRTTSIGGIQGTGKSKKKGSGKGQ